MTKTVKTRMGSIAILAVAISASVGGVARAEPARGASAFGAVSCSANEPSHADLGVKVPTKEVARAGQSGSAVQRAAQVTRSDKADVTFEVRPASGGAIEVSGRSGELQVKKTVQSSGDSVLELSTP